MLTTIKVATGSFDVYWNGAKTEYSIHNSRLGLTGKDTKNLYTVVKGDVMTRATGMTLQGAKGIVELWLKKGAI